MKTRLVGFFLVFPLLLSFDVRKVRELLFHQKKVILKEPVAFVVKGGIAFVLDRRAGNVKIYDRTGKLVRVFGRRGQGPDEFLNPMALSSWQDFLLVYDFKKKKLFLYKITPEMGLQFYKSAKFYDFAFHFKFLNSEELLVSGHSQEKEGNKTYSVFKFNLKKGRYQYILPSLVCYGVKNEEEYGRKFLEELVILSPENYADECRGEIYFASAVDFRILKRDKEGRVKFFGRKSEKFNPPFVTKEMKRAVWNRQDAKLAGLLSKFSFVEGLFCTKKGEILLIFSSPAGEGRDIYLQIYRSSGEFLRELRVLHTGAGSESEILTYFNRERNDLFFLTSEGDEFKLTEFKLKLP